MQWQVSSIIAPTLGKISHIESQVGELNNYIRGNATNLSNINTENFSVQGIGRASSITGASVSVFNVRIFADPSCFTNTNP